MPTITAFEASPDEGQGPCPGYAGSGAFEEVGQSYDVILRSFEELKKPPHLTVKPFGSMPTYVDGSLALLESGAIVLHIAESHGRLLPEGPDARAHAITWMFAALNTVEPPIVEWEAFMLSKKDKPWFSARKPLLEDNIRKRLGELSQYLGGKDWLDGDFSAADLLMATVLRRLESSNFLGTVNIVDEFGNLSMYVERGRNGPPTRSLRGSACGVRRQHSMILSGTGSWRPASSWCSRRCSQMANVRSGWKTDLLEATIRQGQGSCTLLASGGWTSDEACRRQ